MFTLSNDRTDAKKLELDEKLSKALAEDSVDTEVVLEELKCLHDDVLDHSNTKFRARLERVLESTPLEIFLVVLVIVDVVILLVMLLMDLNILHLHLEDGKKASSELSRALQANCDGNPDLSHYNESNLVIITRYLEQGGCLWRLDSGQSNSSGFMKDEMQQHSRHKRAAGPAKEGSNPTIAVLGNVGHVLHIASVVILAVMVVEVILKIFALGIKYFKGKLEVIDGIVIFISFAMDLYFIDGISLDGVNNGATVLVIFLLWRILRVFNALLVTAKKRLQFRIRVQKRMRKNLEDKIEKMEDDIKNHENHIENLSRLAKRHSVPDYEIQACKPLVRQIKKPSTSAGLASMMQMSMGLMQGMNNLNGQNQRKSGIAENLRNPPSIVETTKEYDSASDVLVDAMDATMRANSSVDVVNNTTQNILPVPLMAAMATDSHVESHTGNGDAFNHEVTHERRNSVSSVCSSIRIPSVEFAKALATGSPSPTSSDGLLLSWNGNSDHENNNGIS